MLWISPYNTKRNYNKRVVRLRINFFNMNYEIEYTLTYDYEYKYNKSKVQIYKFTQKKLQINNQGNKKFDKIINK